MERFNNIKLTPDQTMDDLKRIVSKKMGIPASQLRSFRIVKKSIDARNKSDIRVIYSVEADTNPISETATPTYPTVLAKERPVIAGFGPAGIFCALVLAKAGLKPIVLEKGDNMEARTQKVEAFWTTGVLDEESNVQFGEGGAGTFSDGKLTTLINSPLCAEVLRSFYLAGAPEEILYLSKPHIGTDNLKKVVMNLRNQIQDLGGEILFRTSVTDLETLNSSVRRVITNRGRAFFTDRLILATGHSGREIYRMLHRHGILMTPKAFSVGVRIEHEQRMINRSQYGRFAEHPNLPPAEYKLVYHAQSGRSAYTFCMCPGGVVVASSSEKGTIVTNGMSNFRRDGINANSALLVGVDPKDFGSEPLSGVAFQEQLERKAFELGRESYRAPCQRAEDFMRGRISRSFSDIFPTYRPGITPADLNQLFPEAVSETLKSALLDMNRKLNGFLTPSAPLTGVESRTSAPLRVERNELYQSPSLKGLYPCGEGCGYAGGIMSAAVDGIRIARGIICECDPNVNFES